MECSGPTKFVPTLACRQGIAMLIIAMSLLLATTSPSADTYRWKDKDGKIYYGAAVPAEFADQPYEILNDAGIVIGQVQATPATPEVRVEQAPKKTESLISEEEFQRRSDRLLLVKYRSEEDIATALEQEIVQFGYDAKLINLSFDTTNAAIREFIKKAADQQRAGGPIRREQQKEIKRLYNHLIRDEKRLANLEERKARTRVRLQADLERYRHLTSGNAEPPDQG